jgi:hypothetical protein
MVYQNRGDGERFRERIARCVVLPLASATLDATPGHGAVYKLLR